MFKEGLGKLDKKWEERERKEELALAEKRGWDAAAREGEERERWGRVEGIGAGRGGFMVEGGRGGLALEGLDTTRRLGRLEDAILLDRERERDRLWVEERERRGGSSFDGGYGRRY